jgi:Saxitoxin biosynthesis operon protein SxtJ
MIHLSWSPTDRHLRQFAWACLAGFALIGWMLRRAVGPWTIAAGLALGLGLLLIGLARPKNLRLVYVTVLALTAPIGWLVSNLMAAALYYLVFTPLGLYFRAIGRDPLALRARQAPSGWSQHRSSDDPRSYYRQG